MNASHNHQFWVDVAVFEDLNHGQALAAFLNRQGVETRTYDDKWFRYFLFLRPPRVTWRVQVRESQLDMMTDSLREKKPMPLAHAIHCPACGSLRVAYPQMTRKFILPTVLLHLGIIFRLIEHQCYCEQCHEMWNLPEKNAAGSGCHSLKPSSS